MLKVVELELENIAFKEYLLIYNSLPDKILSGEEALEIRKQILEVDPMKKQSDGILACKDLLGK